jgi:gliding motility-associated-like protein
MKPIAYLLCVGWLCLCAPLFSQVTTTITPASPVAPVGSNVTLQLKVTGFTDIISVQFPITYNNAVLQFVSLDNFTLPGFTAANYNAQPAQGKVNISWFADLGLYPNGYTLANNTTVFNINFTVLTNGTSPVNLSNVAPGIEMIKANGQPQTVNFQAGGATVTAGSGGPGPLQGFKIMANTIYIPAGETKCMPVTVNDFDSIVAMQYAMHWDPAVVEYKSTQAYNLPGLSATNFNLKNSSTLTMTWDDVTTLGISRPDGAKIYEVCFKGVGASGTNSLVNFDAVGLPPGTPADATNAKGVNVWKSSTPVTDTLFVIVPAPPANAVTFTLDKDTAAVAQQTCIDVTVANFDSVISLQLGFGYDPTRLQFQSIQLGANPLALSLATNFNTTISGQIRLQWFDPNVKGVSLPDNTVLFSICFTVLGPQNVTTPVTIGSFPNFPLEVAKEPAGPVVPALNNGSVFMTPPVTCAIDIASVTNVSCFGGNNGTINTTPKGGTGYTFKWSDPNGQTVEDAINLSAGVYTVTLTAAGGCTATNTATVTQPTAITATFSVTNVSCFGGSDGAINITPNGGTPNPTAPAYFYNWSGPSITPATQTNEDQTNLKAGNYRFTITDSRGCVYASPNIQLTQPTGIALNPQQPAITPVSCFGGSDGAISITVTGGTGALTYMWTGPTGQNYATEDISGLVSGIYQLQVTDSKGCTSGAIPINVPGPTSAVAASNAVATNVTCFGKNDGTIGITLAGGSTPYTYVWKNTTTGTTVSALQNPINLAPGTYNVTVSDAKLCTATLAQPVTVQGPSAVLAATETHDNVLCPGGNTGSINLTITGGWGGTNVAWIPAIPGGGTSPSGLPAGVYTPILSDNGGCIDTLDPITISAPPTIAYSGQPVVTGVTPCRGDANGSISIALTGGNGGPYSVSWPGGQSGTQLTNLSGGSYTPIVTDAQGCTAVLNAVNVFEPTAIDTSDIVVIDQSGTQDNGSISLTFSGGILPYNYLWDGPGTFSAVTEDISNLAAGDYTLTLTDGLGCTYVFEATIKSDVGVVVTSITPSCGDDGCINMQLTPASVPPFTVTYTGGLGPRIFTERDIALCGLAGGNYNITISDGAGNVLQLPNQQVVALQQSIASSQETNPNDDFKNGSIILTGVPSNAPYSFVWNDGFNGNARINLDSGTYCVTITNLNSNCTSTQCFPLTRTYPPFVGGLIVTKKPDCSNTANGSIFLNVMGGDGPTYTFKWEGPNGYTSTEKNIDSLLPGLYTVSVTDESQIVRTLDTLLVSNSVLSVTNVNETSNYNGFQVSGADECDGTALAVVGGAVGIVTVQWSNGVSGLSNNALCAGTFTVTVTDALGCQSTWQDSLTAPPPLAPSVQAVSDFGGFNVSCNGECNGIMRVRVAGGVAPYEVEWPTGEFDELTNSNQSSEAKNLCGGEYAVTVTDKNNVETIYLVTVTEPAPLTADFSAIKPTRFTTCDGELLLSSPGAVGILNGIWSTNNGQTGDGVRADGLCAGEVVEFVVQDENGCALIASDTVPYPEDGCLIVRPVITPGLEDGNNDYMLITCIEAVENTVEIYNRWGQLVLPVIENYNNSNRNWQGRSGLNEDGAALPEGVYFYVLKYTDDEGNARQQKGYVNLLR